MGYKVSMNISNLLQINYIYIYIYFYIAELVWDCAVMYLVMSLFLFFFFCWGQILVVPWQCGMRTSGGKKVWMNFILIIINTVLCEKYLRVAIV